MSYRGVVRDGTCLLIHRCDDKLCCIEVYADRNSAERAAIGRTKEWLMDCDELTIGTVRCDICNADDMEEFTLPARAGDEEKVQA